MQNKFPIKQYRINYDKFNILVYIIDICNYTCQYCYNNKPRTKKYLNLNILFNFIKFIRQKTIKIIELDLIGGEPTLHPDLLTFCIKLQTISNIIITIYTNFATNILLLKQLEKVNVKFEATWHSQCKDFEQRLTQFNTNSFRTITLMYEKSHTQYVIDMARRLNAYYNIDIQPVIIGDHFDSYTDIQLKTLNIYEQVEDRNNAIFALEYNDNSIEYLTHNDIYYKTHYNYRHWICNAGYDLLYIHYNGNVYPCDGFFEMKKHPIINIYNMQLNFKLKKTLCLSNSCPHEDNVTKQIL